MVAKTTQECMWEFIYVFLCLLKAQYFQCVEKLEKELVPNYRKQFEELYKAEAPTWETHGNLMVFFCLCSSIKLTKCIHLT